MHREGEEVHIDSTEARSGDTPHVVRYVLIIGLLLAIIALSAVWMTGAASAPQGDRNGEVTNQAVPQR